MIRFEGRKGQKAGIIAAALLWGGVAGSVVFAEVMSNFPGAHTFLPDGKINEFINLGGIAGVGGDGQTYFFINAGVVVTASDEDNGAILAKASISPGVVMRRDNSTDGTAATRFGFFDRPGALQNGDPVPTGFNLGRAFASYNPNAYTNAGISEGAYFLAMDISAPARLDIPSGSVPLAFDVDGDGSLLSQSEINPNVVSEAPTQISSPDVYTISIDLDGDNSGDLGIIIGERRGAAQADEHVFLCYDAPTNGVGPAGCNVASVNCALAAAPSTIRVRRFIRIIDGTGLLPPAQLDRAKLLLDANNDGLFTTADVGICEDVEIVVRRLNIFTALDTDGPSCASFAFAADTFDDLNLGGGAEDAIDFEINVPDPSIEASKRVRCAEATTAPFTETTTVVPGEVVEYEVTVQNTGNTILDVTLADVLECGALVPSSCSVLSGAFPDPTDARFGTFCSRFQTAITSPGGFTPPIAIGRFLPADPCIAEPAPAFRFRFRVTTPNNLCTDCDNEISVRGASIEESTPGVFVPLVFNSILATKEITVDSNDADDEEEHCELAACCTGVPGCIAGDAIGDVPDELTIAAVVDNAGVADTQNESVTGDNNQTKVLLECHDIAFRKEVRLLPSGTFVSGDTELTISGATFPIFLEYRYTVTNNGEVTENVAVTDSNLCADLVLVAGASPVAGLCAICDNPTPGVIDVSVNATSSVSSTCRVEITTLEAALELAALDDARTGCRSECDVDGDPDNNCFCYRNCANAQVLASAAPCGPGAEREDSTAQVCFSPECELTVTKQIRCLENCVAIPGVAVGEPVDSLMAVPGSCAEYVVRVTNNGGIAIPIICIDDLISCGLTISDFSAFIGAVDRTALFAAFTADGTRRCFNLGANALPSSAVLTLRFRIDVPANYPILNLAPDCRNEIEVEGYESASDNTALPPAVTCEGSDFADLDIKVPLIECDKDVAVDLGNNNTIDLGPASTVNVATAVYPMRLVYTFTHRNRGELPFLNAKICDAELVKDAVLAGGTVQNCDLCDGACDGANDDCAEIGNLNPLGTVVKRCEIVFADQDQWRNFARDDGDGRGDCYRNEAAAEADIVAPCPPVGFPTHLRTEPPCAATVCVPDVPDCGTTKAKFDIWNQNEVRFSGTERCIISWDQEYLSQYTEGNIANHFGIDRLQTAKGRARIDGIESPVVCGSSSISAPLLGVAAKVLTFSGPRGLAPSDEAGITVVGSGIEPGYIRYDVVEGGKDDAGDATGGVAGGADESARADITTKGSLFVFPKVEIKWDAHGNLIQDTILDLTNDYSQSVRVQLYFVNGDQYAPAIFENGKGGPHQVEREHLGCNAVDVLVTLTGNQPTYWSAASGLPRGVSPFTILDPGVPEGRPDTSPNSRPGDRVLRGYVIGWAVNDINEEIRWNHLKGDAAIVNYRATSAWEYNSWNFKAVAGLVEGDLLLHPPGELNLDGVEYAFAPARLVFDFYASGYRFPYPGGVGPIVDTHLTLWMATKDLRKP